MPNSLDNLTGSAIHKVTLSDGLVLHFRKFTLNDYGQREHHIKQFRFNITDKLSAILGLTNSLKQVVIDMGDDEKSRNQMFAILLGALKDGVQEAFSRPSYVSTSEEAEFEMSRYGVAYDISLVCNEYRNRIDDARMLVYSLNESEMLLIVQALDFAKEREAIKNSDSLSDDMSHAQGSTQESASTST